MRNASYSTRHTVNDIVIFNTVTLNAERVPLHGEYVESRRNHVAVVVGNFMIVHGGTNHD